jgi:hypothetical protein
MKKATLGLVGIMLAAVFAPAGANAADEWKWGVTPYLWAAGIDGTVNVGGHEADISQTFSDIVKDLDFGFMVNLQARKERFGLYSDVAFIGLGDTTDVTNPAGAAILEVTASVDEWIVDFGASWEVARWAGCAACKSGFVDLLLGGRYWNIQTELQAEHPAFPSGKSIDKSLDWIDPLVGARFATDLTPKLSLIGRADVGGFEIGDASKLTWSASAYLGWRFSPLVSGWAGYKYLSVEREDDRDNSVDLAMSGPVLGVAFTF